MLDVENGSVGAGLVRLVPGALPKLFAQTRVPMPLARTRSAASLVRAAEVAALEALQHTSLVAARVRHSKLHTLGDVSRAVVFLHAPWSTLASTKRSWNHEPEMVHGLRVALASTFGDIPATFRPFSTAALHTTNTLFEQQGSFLLCTITGEMAELLLVKDGNLEGRATIPLGSNLALRTLQSHTGMSQAEARSALLLAHDAPTLYPEPLSAAANHFSAAFRDAAREILDTPVTGVLIIGTEPGGTWAAKTLSVASPPSTVPDPFAEDTVVRTLNARHIAPYIAAHAHSPDIALMVATVFVASKINEV